MSDILADLQRYAALFDRSPRASRLECGYLVPEVLKAASTPVKRQPWTPADLSAVPIVVKADMSPLAWRMLDQHGEVMKEGEIGRSQDSGSPTPSA